MMTEKLEEKTLLKVMENYEIPSNLQELRVPLVNDTIWNSLSSKVRSLDLKAQRVQKFMFKGVTAALKEMTVPKKSEEDSLACLIAVNNELNMLRRELIGPELNQRYAHLCRSSVKVTSFLFGDDLGKQIKDLTENQKATWQIVKQKPSIEKEDGIHTFMKGVFNDRPPKTRYKEIYVMLSQYLILCVDYPL